MADGTWTRRRLLVTGAALAATGCSVEPDVESVGARRLDPSLAAGAATGFGSVVELGTRGQVEARLAGSGRGYYPQARAWVVSYPAEHLRAALAVYDEALHPGLEAGLLALWQKCPHLGCRVPECATSGYFECPCHVSRFSGVGEYRDGPSPRGMDLFPILFGDDRVLVDTSRPIEGLPVDVDVTGQRAAGPLCT